MPPPVSIPINEKFSARIGGRILENTDGPSICLISSGRGGMLHFQRDQLDGVLKIRFKIHDPSGEYICSFEAGKIFGQEFAPYEFTTSANTFKLWHRDTKAVICAVRGGGDQLDVWFHGYSPHHGVGVLATPDAIQLSHGLTAGRSKWNESWVIPDPEGAD